MHGSIRIILICCIISLIFRREVHGSGFDSQPEKGIFISGVVLNGDSVISAGDLKKLSDPEKGLVIDYDYNDIRFELASTGKNELQFHLEGFDANSDRWGRSS